MRARIAAWAAWMCHPLTEEIGRLWAEEWRARALLISQRIDALETLCASLTEELDDLRNRKQPDPPRKHVRTVPVRQFLEAAGRAQRSR